MDELSSVVRIPIAGPEPFNTLVAVHESGLGSGIGGVGQNYPGGWYEVELEFQTAFSLIGYEPPPRKVTHFKHSTTAVMQFVELGDDATFHAAVDAVVSAEFDLQGRWTVRVESLTDVPSNNHLILVPYISSWVLCYEPPPDREDERFHQFVPGLEEFYVFRSGWAEEMRPFG